MRLLALLVIAALLVPAVVPSAEASHVYVYGDLSGYAFLDFLDSKGANYTVVNSLEDVSEARSVIAAPADRNDTLYKKATKLVESGVLLIIVYDGEHDYAKRLDFFDARVIGNVNESVYIERLPFSARSAGVRGVYASGALFNATYAKKNVLIPGRLDGEQNNETAFALYKKRGNGRAVLVNAAILEDPRNTELFNAIYRTLYRVSYPAVKGYEVKSLATAPPGTPFTVYVVNASTFDLEPYYKSDNDISVRVYVYRYSNGSQVTTLILNYDSYKKAYFFPATDFGGKRGVFEYNVTVSRKNGTLIYSHAGLLRLASDEGIVIGYLNASEGLVEALYEFNYVAFQVNSTEELAEYYADALLVGESINGTLLNMTLKRFREGGSFIGIAGNRSSAINVELGENLTYASVEPTRRFANVSVDLSAAPYIVVKTRYSVPLILGDNRTLAAMIENANGGKALIVSTERLVDPARNLDVLLALISNASERHRLNVSYKAIRENDSRVFYIYLKDDQGNPINATFVFVSGAEVELIAAGEYRAVPLGENFTVSFYEPGYGYKTISVSLGDYPENPGTSPGENPRSYEGAKNVGFRTFVAFLVLVAIIAGAFYTFKRRRVFSRDTA